MVIRGSNVSFIFAFQCVRLFQTLLSEKDLQYMMRPQFLYKKTLFVLYQDADIQ